jgi:ribosomal protein S12 methylthiotransferase accessory factor
MRTRITAKTSTYKAYRKGTHRTLTPTDTLERARPLLSNLGITRIANVTGLDRIGIPVVMVCRPNARSIAVSQGKGLNLDAAKASGLMEAVETYHAEHITLPLLLGSYAELRAQIGRAHV